MFIFHHFPIEKYQKLTISFPSKILTVFLFCGALNAVIPLEAVLQFIEVNLIIDPNHFHPRVLKNLLPSFPTFASFEIIPALVFFPDEVVENDPNSPVVRDECRFVHQVSSGRARRANRRVRLEAIRRVFGRYPSQGKQVGFELNRRIFSRCSSSFEVMLSLGSCRFFVFVNSIRLCPHLSISLCGELVLLVHISLGSCRFFVFVNSICLCPHLSISLCVELVLLVHISLTFRFSL